MLVSCIATNRIQPWEFTFKAMDPCILIATSGPVVNPYNGPYYTTVQIEKLNHI